MNAALLAVVLIVGSAVAPLQTVFAPSPAEAVDLPPIAVDDLVVQTSGPNVPLSNGDWYTAAAANGGGGQDHLIEIFVPSNWPGLPVTVALFDPELETPDPSTPLAVDQILNTADTATFTLVDPVGATIATQTYAPGGGTNGQWTELVTFTPATSGVYQLLSSTSDDDQNSWRVRVANDPDCASGCTQAELDDGDEIDDPDGIPGTGDELSVGIQRASFEHFGGGTVCSNFYFFVDGSSSNVTLHNFDMDGAGSITYFPPDGSTVSGTVSGNQTWNNSASATRVGDIVPVSPARIGWWRANVCVPAGNQYIFEGVDGEVVFLEDAPPAPSLTLTKDDGTTSVEMGDTITYQLDFTNPSNGTSTPGSAESVVLLDDLPAGVVFQSCSFGAGLTGSCTEASGLVTAVLDQNIPAGSSGSVSISVDVVAPTGASITNNAQILWQDTRGNTYPSESASDVDSISGTDLAVFKTTNTAVPSVGDTVTFTVTVAHQAGDPATGVEVTDLLPIGLSYLSHSASAGSYAPGSGLWIVGGLGVGATETLTIDATVIGSSGVYNVAELTAADQIDPDSTPANSNTTEDDYALVDLAVGGGGNVCWLVADNGGGNGGDDILTLLDGSGESAIGTGTGTFNIESIAFQPITEILYTSNGGQFGSIDTATGVFTPIGPGGLGDVDGMAFDLVTLRLYGSVRRNGSEDLLIEIDTATGQVVPGVFGGSDSLVIRTNVPPVNKLDIDDFAIDPEDNTLYGIANSSGGGDRLVIVDRETGAVTDIGLTSLEDIEGLSFDNAGNLFGSTGTNPERLFELDKTTGQVIPGSIIPLIYGDYESIDCDTNGYNTISGSVFLDKDANSAFGGSDSGTDGVTVRVWRDTNNTGAIDAGDTLVGQQTTSSGGGYLFTTGATGAFLVDVDPTTLPAGATFTTDNYEDADFGASFGLADPGNDFGYTLPSSLDVAKTSDADAATQPGDQINYTITVTNPGTTIQTGIVVTDPLPVGTSYVPGSTTGTWFEPSSAPTISEDWESTDDAWIGGTGWATDRWTEVGESDGSDGGDIRIESENGSTAVRIQDNDNGGEGVERSVDLSGWASATLSYDFDRALGDADDYVMVLVSTDGSPFVEINRHSGPADDSGFQPASLDLTPYLGADTLIRFLSSATNGGGEEVHFDNIAITGEILTPVVKSNATGAPDPLADGVPADLVKVADNAIIPPGGTMTVTYSIVVDDPAPARSVVNTVTASSDQSSPDTATRIDPLNVASIADVVWEDLDADGIQDAGEPGLDGVTVELLDGGVVTRTTTTAGDGSYRLAWLSPGSYEVRFTAPAGYLFSPADQGSDDTADSDANAANGVASPIVLDAGENLTTVDAGLYQLATIGDRVWDDLDADGVQDAGEPGLGGLTIELLDSGGAVVGTTTTAADGSYSFDVVPGTYSARATYPVDAIGSPMDQGGDEAADSDADPGTGETGSITVTSGAVYDDLDIGMYTRGTLGDLVFDDLNGNGIQDVGETGIAGITVELLDSGGAVVDTTTTGAAGDYAFIDIEPGDHSVRFTTPAGYRPSPADAGGDDASDSDPDPATGETGTITVLSGTDDNSIDAGFYVPVRLGDLVWVDADSDGIQDPGELGAAGLTVNLLDGSNAVIGTTTTASDGTYGFANLDPGLYRVEVLAPGFSFTSRDQGADDALDSDVSTFNGRATVILSGGGDDDTIDAGILPAVLGDFVWDDLDGDGVQDAGEPGVAGATVNLLDAGGLVIATTSTALDGSYSFEVGPGTYELEFVAPASMVFTTTGSGTSATDSDADLLTGRSGPITVADDSGDLTIDAGLYTPVDLGNRVWEDLDADGVQDSGEIGLAGVTVQLRNSFDVAIATTTTNSSGFYSFANLVPGDYSVVFVAPAGYQFSPANNGGDDTADSDPASGTGATGTVALVSGIDDTTIDAGLYRLGSIGNFVWVDIDSDGVQDAGEPGLAGVTVNVLDAGNSIVGSAVTAADGSYVVGGLTPAAYTVEFVAPGYTFAPQDAGADDAVDSDPDSSGTTGSVTVTSGATVTSVDAGVEPILLGDFAFVDTDADGVQDPGEPGLAGVAVELLLSGSVVQTTVTAADGSYSFQVAPGIYELRFSAPGSYETSLRNQGGDDSADSDIDQATGTTAPISVPGPADDTTIDAGFYLLASIGDHVWDDLDADGIQDVGEPGIDGVAIELRNDVGALIAATTTAGGGLYSFSDLIPGDYTVAFVSPAGASPTSADAGVDDAADSDIDAGGDVSITLLSGETNDSIDAGYVTPASIGDLVWDDLDGDGVRDAGEAGLAGIPVELLDGSGAVVSSTTSAPDGSYGFSAVSPGSYRVRFGVVGTYQLTDQDQGGDDNTDSDADPATGETALFAVVSGESNLTVDAGLVAPATLGDTLWFDSDGDGVQDLGEPGVPGVVVELLDSTNSVVATDTTDASGDYGFAGLEPGDYSIRVVGTGLVFTAQDSGGDDAADSDVDGLGASGSITLISGDVNSSLDAGIIPSSIGDRVFVDLDGDGQAEPGDPGLAGVTVELLDDVGSIVTTTTSAADGSYLFENLLPGDYGVRFTAPAGYEFTAQDAVGDAVDSDADASGLTAPISLAGGTDISTIDAGLYQRASLGDFVWDDLDGDGAQDVSEPGIDGVTVELRSNGGGSLIATTTTAAGGSYGFSGLIPGTYELTFIAPGASVPTTADAGGDNADSDIDGSGSTTVTLTSNQNDTSIDAGFVTPATIGDFVWEDLDGDGIQGAIEVGFGGVAVDLVDSAGVVVAGTTTAGDGSYSFANVAPGDYRVRFTPSGIYGLTAADQGPDDTADSDADVVTGETGLFTVISGDTITSVDAGLVAGASIGDFIWFDVDADGVQDATEPGVPALTVQLLNSVGTVVGSTVTLADGSYAFGGLAPGDYSIRVLGAGNVFTAQGAGGDGALDSDVNASGASGAITLTSGLVVTDVDAGLLPSSIGDFVWEDTNGNGVQDAGESGLAGVAVELLDSGGATVATDITTVGGAYRFDLLLPGTYSVRFTTPAGYSPIAADAGGDSVDSDIDGSGLTPAIALAGNTDDDTVDAGFYRPAAIGNFVWDDLDGDGVQDSGEPGVDGVVVELRNGAGTLVSTVTTTLGFYSFAGLVPGDYSLTFIGIAGSVPTGSDAGSDDGIDSDINASGLLSVSLESGENNMTLDAGFVSPATVGDFVWDDLDGDGIQDLGEPGIGGATVELLASDGSVLQTSTTAADGSYSFTGVSNGTYRVRFTPPVSYNFAPINTGSNDSFDSDANQTTGETAPFALQSGEVNNTIDAGFFKDASIGDRVWIDADGDGVQDGGEPGASGLTVELLEGGVVVATTTTLADGSYQFAGLAPGTYVVRLPDSDLVFTAQNATDDALDSDVDAAGLSDSVTILSGQTLTSLDSGVLPSTIGDFVWTDTNANGIQDAGEPGLGGITVELLDGSGSLIATTISAADGSYVFDLLLPGAYQVRFVAPVGYTLSPVDVDSDDDVDSDADLIGRTQVFGLAGNTDETSVDAGLFEEATLGDRVWVDLNNDGIQSPSEPGVGGLDVNLIDSGGSIVATDITDASGAYQFTGVVPGDYTVEVVAPGFSFVAADSGGDDALDSDVASATGITPTISIASAESNTTVDAGVEPATVGDFVWDDLDGDGVQDIGEPGIGGVTVNLLDGGGAVIDSTTTAADGRYGFVVAPGTYEVEFVIAVGSEFSPPRQGDDGAFDSDADPVSGRTGTFAVAGSGSYPSYDAGIVAPATIGDTVFQDFDGDGIEDVGDTGLDGVAVNLVDTDANVVATATTAAGGQYVFTGLAPGTYRVDVVDASVPGGYVLTTSDPLVVSVISGQTYLDADFGYEPTGSVSITKDPATQAVVTGGTADFTITVSNTGGSAISNVVVTDPIAPACGQAVGSLVPGESATIVCSLAGVTADLTNTASVSAEGPGGIPLNDSDTADVIVEQPGITITKSPANQTVVVGETASFTITVTNTGATELTDVTVSDPAAPLCDNSIGAMASGETATYSCDLSPVAVDFTNTASVVGDDPIGNQVSASDSADVDVISPAIQLIKSPATQSVVPNGTASFTVTVTNTGDAPLSNVVVSDPLTPDCDTTIGSLAIGATTSITCDEVDVTAGFINTATVVGEDPTGSTVTDDDDAEVLLLAPSVGIVKDPATQTIITGSDATFSITVTNNGDAPISNVVVSDPQAPACDNSLGNLAIGASATYSCVVNAVSADFTNTATVDAEDPGGNPLTAADDADVDVIAPSVAIVKDPANQSIVSGNTATFSITVSNTGDADLVSVAVADPLAPACAQFIGNLAAGGTATYNCDLTNVTSSFVNVASVTGEDPIGGTVSDNDTAQVRVLTPSIEITKNPANQQVLLGDDASFSITVTNTGDANLSSVEVSDPQATACDNTIGDLPVGAAVTYTCVLNNVAADLINTATVDAEDPQGGSLTDSDDAAVDVINPGISIVKDPAIQSILTGSDATFTITVTNIGDVALTDVTVTDGPVSACDNSVGDLAVGASVSYSCSQVNVTADFTNTARVVGTDPIAGTVSDTDDADVTVLVPGINILKTTSTPQVVLGGTASFDITVTNTGTAPLTNVEVTDPLAPLCDRTIGALASGESISYTCSLAGLVGDVTNRATVTGDDSSGTQHSDTDTEPVDVISPEILISKTPNNQTVIVNGAATFSITVTNVGDVPLMGVTVSDALAPDCDRALGDLAASSSMSYSCTLSDVTAGLTNSATATGTHPVSGPVQSTDTADVTILTPGISIAKTAVDSVVRSGSDAEFDIIVSNSGETDLTNVVVVDPLASDCENVIGDLALGAVVSYSCTLAAVTADFVNTASVSGDDAVGNAVADADSASIDVIDPTIRLDKTPDLQQLLTGETATFTITVTNEGDVPLIDVSVSDPLTPDCDRPLADLAPGGTASFTCTSTNVTADFTNVATVEATDPLGDVVSDSDDAAVDVVSPGIDIQKTPDNQTILTGDLATFTITVTNNGDQDIVDGSVSDPLAPNCRNLSIGPIATGASVSYVCDSGILNSDLVNVASVEGTDVLGNVVSDSDDASVRVIDPSITIDKTPDAQAVVVGGTANFTITVANSGNADLVGVTVTDPLSPSCDSVIGSLAAGSSASYSCALSPVPADFTNTATVVGDDELGNQHQAQDTADVAVLTPALDLTKDPGLQIVSVGGDATFTISVTNSGQTPLTNVAVSDPESPDCDNSIGALAVGQTVTFSCVATGVGADFINTASGSGEDPLGRTVTDDDTALVDVIAPSIDIEKSPATQNILAGADAAFTITVTNTGDSDLSSVAVTDTATPTCDLAIGDLAVGDSVSYTCAAGGVSSTFTNVADVAGNDPGGNAVTDSDGAVVDVTQIGSVTGLVFLDMEADGLFNNADLLLAGVPVDLVDGGGNVVTTILTDGAGEYRFVDVPVGDYTVDVFGSDPSIPAGSLLTTANDPQPASVVANTETRASDTGYAPPSTLSGRAFTDDNGDGVDNSEPGIGAVSVSVWRDTTGNGVPDTVVATTPTASDGTWLIHGLRAGSYSVQYLTPAGLQPTFADLGGDDTVDSDIDPGTGFIPTLALGTGDAVTDLDAGYFTPGSIGDLVFADPNGNAVQDVGEVGLAGIDLVATWAGPDGTFATTDDQVYTETTVAGGSYLFSGLPGGRFSVEVVEPVGSNVTTGNDPVEITIAPGGTNLDADFGLDGNGIISGTVYSDLNNDGIRDGVEPGIEAVTVTLTGTDVNGISVSLSTTTGVGGDYSFTNLDAGTYTINEIQPTSFLDGLDSLGSAGGDGSVNDEASAINLPAGGNGFAYDFGEVAISSLSGLVQTVGGDPISGVTLTLTGTDDRGGAVSVVTLTAADGSYSFTDLRPGTYLVTETQPADYGEGGELAGSAGGTAALNEISDVVLVPATSATGYIFTETTGSISGTVYNDRDDSGDLGPGDPGIGGVELTLTGADTNGAFSATTTSAPDGTYSFDGLLPGTYEVTETQPSAYADAIDSVGSLGGDASTNDVVAAIPVQAGEIGTGYNFGETGIEISGRVYLDRDSNGLEDGTDSPLGGIVIILLDSTGSQIAAASTAADGAYQFTELSAGDYTVQQVQPPEWGSSTPNEILFTLANTGRSGLDFGETPASISGSVFADDESDGISSGDFAIENVEVTLVDSSGTTISTTLTAADGSYIFEGLLSGQFSVVVTAPDGSTFSPVDSGADDLIDSDFDRISGTVIVDVAPGQNLTNLDAGITPIVYDVAVGVTVLDGNYRPNDQIPFTVSATNNSNTVLSGGVVVAIPLASDASLISAVGDGWTVTQSGTAITAQFDGDLALGQSAPPITVTLMRSTPGSVRVPATITIVDPGITDAVPPNNVAEAVESVNAPPTIPVPSLPVTGATTAVLLAVGGFFVFSGRGLLFFSDRKRDEDEEEQL